MKAISNSDLAQFINELPSPAEKFVPTATYDPDGDFIEFMFRPDDYYAQRIDDLVTVYYSRESNELIGSVIKNISGLKRKYPSVFAISVQDGRVTLSHFFIAAAAIATGLELDGAHLLVYRKLIKVAEDTGATAELIESAN